MFRNRIIASIAFMSRALGGMADANAADTLTMARISEVIFLGAEQVALKKGFFEAEGIDLQFLVATGSAGTTAMMAGEADIAPSLAQFIPAADQGAPLVGFAAAFNQFGILWALSNEAIAKTGVSPDAPIADKIGRASCRERVCQYV